MAERVTLYVYDLTQGMASMLSGHLLGKQIDGIWHTSVVVGGVEYYFSAGIQRASPGRTHFGTPGQIIELGETEVPSDVREELIRDMSDRFTPDSYNVLSNNCNNFSNELATMLTGNGIPSHILNLPAQVLSTPMGSMFRPLLEQMGGQLGNITEERIPVTASLANRSVTCEQPASSPQSSSTSLSPEAPQEQSPVTKGGATTAAAHSGQLAFEAAVKHEFAILMAQGGLTPNQAAAMALQRVKEQHIGPTASPRT